MTKEEKSILHYQVIANTAHKIVKVAHELERLNNAYYVNADRISLYEQHLVKYYDELKKFMQKQL